MLRLIFIFVYVYSLITDYKFLCKIFLFIRFHKLERCPRGLTHIEFVLEQHILMRKTQSKKKLTASAPTVVPLDSSLTSIEWLPNMQIGENSSSSSSTITTPVSELLPSTTYMPQKIEPTETEISTTTVNDNIHIKPPYSYVALIRQAIQSTRTQRMTLNEIYQWIVDSYPYFRTAPPKWKVSIFGKACCFNKICFIIEFDSS